ncbi:MAG: NUDIX hydrolase [Halioglobus sp.]
MRPFYSLIVLLMLGACSAQADRTCSYDGEPDYAIAAGCLTVVHGKMLVVDSRTGGLTPPGGKSKEGESAQCTAHRETLEETGLDLIPRELLAVFETGFHLYSCDIHAGSGRIKPAVMEVKRGFWLNLSDFDSVQWRYPGQDKILRNILMPETDEKQ